MFTLVPGDVLYFGFYLLEKDPTSGESQPHDLSGASSVIFKMREYGANTFVLEETMQIVDATLGYCRVLATVPPEGTYSSYITVYEGELKITWLGPKIISSE